MSKKIHLDSVTKPDGIIWFTLVFESDKEFFVEKCHDTNLPFLKNKYEKIEPKDFGKHSINGKNLNDLVAQTLNEVYSRN